MHLLYLDDSGSTKNAQDKYVILAGICVFERVPYHFSNELDKLAKEVWPDSPNLEFHGTDIFSGKKHWRGLDKNKRLQTYKRALSIIARSSRAHLFGAVINKAAVHPNDPMEFAFEQLCSRFDRFLGRLHVKEKNTQRGLIVFDKSSYETSIQNLTRAFRSSGHRWGQTRNIAEVPLFVDSKATRMIQYADLIAFALHRFYNLGESEYFNLLSKRFDEDGGIIHGLVHYTEYGENCICTVCKQKLEARKAPQERLQEGIQSLMKRFNS
jgi:hypothetical protein